jgi:hypothetical protein
MPDPFFAFVGNVDLIDSPIVARRRQRHQAFFFHLVENDRRTPPGTQIRTVRGTQGATMSTLRTIFV